MLRDAKPPLGATADNRRPGRLRIYASLAELQADLDAWIESYNTERAHQGRWCFGRTPMRTFLDTVPLAQEKLIAA